MNQEIKLLIIISFLLLIIDIPMITKINYEMYNKQLLRINGNKIVNDMLSPAIFTYICLIYGIYYFVIKDNLNKSLNDIGIRGAIFGFIVYGVYNGTNKATIAEYGIDESIKDTIWGSILCSLVSILTVYITKNFNL